MMTDAELRAEAERLTALDDAGREKELVYLALRLGSISEEAAQELQNLDYRFLQRIAGKDADVANEMPAASSERPGPRL